MGYASYGSDGIYVLFIVRYIYIKQTTNAVMLKFYMQYSVKKNLICENTVEYLF